MQTNLIQNYIAYKPSYQKKFDNKDKLDVNAAPQFNIKDEVNEKEFLKPLRPTGHLVKNNITNLPVTAYNDMKYNCEALKNSIAGRANDHQLGKVNDMGMLIGGLGIAAYLATLRQTPLTKAMEFVGLASFFASMKIWPMLGIQLPAKLIHGINVREQYEDSFGRKKSFYQDPQYIPWDMISDEKIQKYGNRMFVPKDMTNRREFIQEKMKKIAIQNNTLWMLTAGFATPVMTALTCNLLEEPIQRYQGKMRSKQADSLINNYTEISAKNVDESMLKEVKQIVEANKDKIIDEQTFKNISGILTKGFDNVVSDAIISDLKENLLPKNYKIDDKIINNIITDVKELFKKAVPEDNLNELINSDDIKMVLKYKNKIVANDDAIKKILGDQEVIKVKPEQLLELLKKESRVFTEHHDKLKVLFAEAGSVQMRERGIKDFSLGDIELHLDKEKLKALLSEINDNYDDFDLKNIVQDIRLIIKSKLKQHSLNKQFTEKHKQFIDAQLERISEEIINKSIKPNQTMIMDAKAQVFINETSNLLNKTKNHLKNLDKYMALKYTETPETVLANYWNDISKDMMKIFNFSSKEIEKTRYDRELVYSLLREKVDTIVSNDEQYKKVLSQLAEKVAYWDNIVNFDGTQKSSEALEKALKVVFDDSVEDYKKMQNFKSIKKLEDAARLELDSFALKNTIRTFFGKDGDKAGSIRYLYESMASNRAKGVKSSFYRIINTLDFYKRAITNESCFSGDPHLPREIKEEIIESAKRLLLQGHSSDYDNKLYFLRNPSPNMSDYAAIEVKEGKLVYKYLGNNKNNLVDIPHDYDFFQKMMKGLYEAPFHPDTESILSNNKLIDSIRQYKADMIKEVVSNEYFAKPHHTILKPEKTKSILRFLLTGIAPDEFFFKTGQKIYNSNKWFKIFSTFGLALLGITTGAQFFFGKMKNPNKN